ncbi:MAG: type II toxin-antitoxin system HicB family antitoxin [Egibacteraceae bacterium]
MAADTVEAAGETAQRWVVLDTAEGGLQRLPLTFRAYAEADAFVGLCDELAVASAGDTPAEAIEMVIEATLLYLDTIEELGERRRVFAERGLSLEPATSSRQTGGPVDVHAGETVTRRLLAPTG